MHTGFSSFDSSLGLPWGTLDDGTRVVFSPYNGHVVAFAASGHRPPEFERQFLESLGCLGEPSVSGPSLPEHFDLTLVVTSACNLRCVYCFASAGDRPESMGPDTAIAIVDGALERTSRPNVKVSFFGGEPTLNMAVVRAVVAHVEREAPRLGKRFSFYITTNGVVSSNDLGFLIDHGFTFVVSTDGAPPYQDRLRPRANGGSASRAVEATIRCLCDRGIPLKVRSTVSSYNVAAMSSNVRYFASLGVSAAHFEPITHAGRGRTDLSMLERAQPDEFVRCFVEALDTAREVGVEVINASYMNFLAPSRKFCDAMAGSRLIGSFRGDISLCVEVQDCHHPYAEQAIVGRTQAGDARAVVDEARYAAALGSEIETQNPECASCFIRYCCGGGCPVKNYYATGCSRVDPYRCQLNRGLMAHVLSRIWDESATRAQVVCTSPHATAYRIAIPDEIWMKRKSLRIGKVLAEVVAGEHS